jgi:hypothetical protein
MLDMLANATRGPWINVAAVAGGLLLVVAIFAIARRGPKKQALPPQRTEAQARDAQADRDRLAGRR